MKSKALVKKYRNYNRAKLDLLFNSATKFPLDRGGGGVGGGLDLN